MIKTSAILFFVVSIIFSTIYTPQAILPELKKVFNISIAQTNLLLSGMLFVLMAITPFYAPISKRMGKKNIMLFATFFLFISVVLSAIAQSFDFLLFSRILQGIFVPGITAIMLSYVQEIYSKSHRGLGMGIYMAATSFGAVIGRLLAGWITYIYSWRTAFSIFAVLLAIAFLSMLVGLPKDKVENAMEKAAIQKEKIYHYIFNIKIVSVLLVPSVVFFSFMAVSTFVTYHLSEAPFYFNASEIGNVFLILLLGVFVSPLAGRYSDLVGRIKILYIGLGSLIVGIFLTLTPFYVFIVLGIGLVTIGMFSVQSVAPTYLGELVPHNKRVTAILYQTFFYFGGALGTLLPAIAWQYYKYGGVAILCIGLIIFGTIPFLSSHRIVKKAIH
jgi:MFS transporter, YNFM family, putative membrane transport protein